MRKPKRIIGAIGIVLVLCLLLIAAMLIYRQWKMPVSTEAYVQRLRNCIPESQGSALEERRDNTMPVFSLDGVDFVGILEIPRYDSAQPVCATWGSRYAFPCRSGGSIYTRTLQIGGTSQKGQYDFFREISVGDAVYFTDMEGNRYSFTVSDLRYEKRADQAALQRNDVPLTLFIKNVYAFEYLIVFCDIAQ